MDLNDPGSVRAAGLRKSEIRRQARAGVYNRRELARELRPMIRTAGRILELGAGGDLTLLLCGLLRKGQIYCGMGENTHALRELVRSRPECCTMVEINLEDLDRSSALGERYDLAVMHRKLSGLAADPRTVLAYAAASLAPGGRLILIEETLDGMAGKSGDLLYLQFLADLEALRGREVFGLHRLADYLSMGAEAGFDVTRRCLIGQDPGPCRNKVITAYLRRERRAIADSVPPERRREAERLIDEASGRIARAAQAMPPLALVVLKKP